MADIRTKIDELIEESYLATLPEEAIRGDLLQFIDTCDKLFRESNGDRADVMARIDRYKETALRIEQAGELADDQEEWAAWSEHDLLAHRAARLKLLVLDLIRESDPGLADQIEHGRFPNIRTESREPVVARVPPPRAARSHAPQLSPETSATLLRASYALLAGSILFIIGYRIIY